MARILVFLNARSLTLEGQIYLGEVDEVQPLVLRNDVLHQCEHQELGKQQCVEYAVRDRVHSGAVLPRLILEVGVVLDIAAQIRIVVHVVGRYEPHGGTHERQRHIAEEVLHGILRQDQ